MLPNKETMEEKMRKWGPVIIAAGIALAALAWYVGSGRSGIDLGARQLAREEEVAEIDTTQPDRVTITCKNGEKYEILFTESQSNYEELIFNACAQRSERAEGTHEDL